MAGEAGAAFSLGRFMALGVAGRTSTEAGGLE